MKKVEEKQILYPEEETWIAKYWRPAIAWQYFAVCMFDFIIAPILTGVFYLYSGDIGPYVSWQPITLQVGGFYHMSMATIIGVSAWSRGNEKIQRYTLKITQLQNDLKNKDIGEV